MRFMYMVKGDENLAATSPPPAALYEAIEKHIEDGVKSGKLVSWGGLMPSSSGVVARINGNEMSLRDGPFTESKEVIGGFSIMELPSLEAAIEELRAFTALHMKHWPEWQGEVEVRQMADMG